MARRRFTTEKNDILDLVILKPQRKEKVDTEPIDLTSFQLPQGYQLSLDNQVVVLGQMLKTMVLRFAQESGGGLTKHAYACKHGGENNIGFTYIKGFIGDFHKADLISEYITRQAIVTTSDLMQRENTSSTSLLDAISNLEWDSSIELLTEEDGKIIIAPKVSDFRPLLETRISYRNILKRRQKNSTSTGLTLKERRISNLSIEGIKSYIKSIDFQHKWLRLSTEDFYSVAAALMEIEGLDIETKKYLDLYKESQNKSEEIIAKIQKKLTEYYRQNINQTSLVELVEAININFVDVTNEDTPPYITDLFGILGEDVELIFDIQEFYIANQPPT